MDIPQKPQYIQRDDHSDVADNSSPVGEWKHLDWTQKLMSSAT